MNFEILLCHKPQIILLFLGMYHIGVMARLREGQKSNEDPFVIKSALGASAGALGKIKENQ